MSTTITTCQQMVDTADAQITELKHKHAAIVQTLDEIEVEIKAIYQGRTERAEFLQKAQTRLDTAQTEHDQAVSYAKLAYKTTNEQKSIKAVSTAQKALATAQKDYDQCANEAIKAKQAADSREQELIAQMGQLGQEQEGHNTELRSLLLGRDRAHAELGAALHTAFLETYQAKQKQIDALHSQLIAAQVDLCGLYESGLAELQHWPDVKHAIRKLALPDDATYRVILATQAYMAALVQDAAQVRYGEIALPWDLRDVLYVREQEAHDPQVLINNERQHRLEQTRAALLEYLQNQ